MNSLTKTLRIVGHFAKLSLMEQTIFRQSFVTAVIGKILRVGLVLLFFSAIYARVSTFAGWNFHHALMLVAIFALVDFAVSITFMRNLAYHFSTQIQRGEFDLVLSRPINPLLWATLRRIDIFDLVSAIPVIGLLVYALAINHIALTFVTVSTSLILIVAAYGAVFAFYLLLASTFFWSVIGSGAGRFAEGLFKLGRVPSDVYTGASRVVFTYIIPVALLATIPAKTLLGTGSWALAAYSIGLSAGFVALSLSVWERGLRHYTSAGG